MGKDGKRWWWKWKRLRNRFLEALKNDPNMSRAATCCYSLTLGFHQSQPEGVILSLQHSMSHKADWDSLWKCIQPPNLRTEIPTPLGRGTDLKVCIISLFRTCLVCSTSLLQQFSLSESSDSSESGSKARTFGLGLGFLDLAPFARFRTSRCVPFASIQDSDLPSLSILPFMAHDFRRITPAITSCFSASKNHGCCGCSQCREGDSRPGLWSVTTRNTSRDPIKYSVAFDHVICVWWMLDVCRLQGLYMSFKTLEARDQTWSNHVCKPCLPRSCGHTPQNRTTLLKTACSPSHPFIIDIELPSQYEHGYNMLHHVAASKRLPSMGGCAYGRTASSHPMISSIRGWSCRFEPWPLPCCATNFNQDYSDIN